VHIILVNRWYPPYSGFGGVAAYNFYLGQALAELGQRVTVLASRSREGDPAFQQDGQVAVHRLLMKEQYYLGKLPVVGRYARPFLQLLYSRQVSRFLQARYREDPFDILEFAEINTEAYTYLKVRQRPPVVVRCHTPTFVLQKYYQPAEMPFDTSWTSRMERACIQKADALSAPSQDMANTIAKECRLDASRFRVIPNPLDTRPFAQAGRDRRPKAPGEGLTILHVGRLERVKGIETLARAIPEVVQQYPMTRFVFVGDDRPDGQGSTWKNRLERYFLEQGVSDNVVLTGGVSQEELLSWYRQADIAVVPSMLYESFSYTCAQAMAAGLPVVASRIGGIPETLGECGLIVKPGNAGQIAAELLKLIANPPLRQQLGQDALDRGQASFEASLVAQDTLDFYRKIIS
jgi:glycosyltransferase involved in cell wall biosynthesis